MCLQRCATALYDEDIKDDQTHDEILDMWSPHLGWNTDLLIVLAVSDGYSAFCFAFLVYSYGLVV